MVGQAAIEARIPRLIHQTFPSKQLPPPFKKNAAFLQDTNSAWEYRLYNDADVLRFITNVYGGFVLKAFLNLNPNYGAARADLFRYLLLYEKGGVYLDIKSSITAPIDDVLREDDQYVLCQWDNGPGERHRSYGRPADLAGFPGGEFQQWHIIAAPRHPFLKAVIEAVLANIASYRPETHGVGWLGVMRTTGPIAYTIAINRVRGLYRHRIARNRELALEYTVLDALKAHENVYRHSHYTALRSSLVLSPGALA